MEVILSNIHMVVTTIAGIAGIIVAVVAVLAFKRRGRNSHTKTTSAPPNTCIITCEYCGKSMFHDKNSQVVRQVKSLGMKRCEKCGMYTSHAVT